MPEKKKLRCSYLELQSYHKDSLQKLIIKHMLSHELVCYVNKLPRQYEM